MKTAILFVALATTLLLQTASFAAASEVGAEAVSCIVTELQPCLPAITSGANPSQQCCSKLKEQQPCLCGYIKNPAFAQYVASDNARKVLKACGVPYPIC